MPYFYLIVSVIMSSSSNVFGKFFNRRNEGKKDATMFYNFLQLIAVFLGWCALYAFDFSFDVKVLPYSVLFAAGFVAANVGVINALKYGSASLTSLLVGLSLILVTIWGFFFWDSKVTGLVVIGLVLVAVAICLCLYTGKKEEKKLSFKWLVFVLLAFFGNACCSISQRTQQMQFNGEHGNMLMVFATLLSAIACFIIYWKSDKRDSREILKTSGWIPVAAGLCNVVLNLFVILLATTSLSPSLIYPVIGVGGLMIVTLFSLFAFEEKLRWQQWLGIAVGAVAIVLLSI